LAENPNVNTGLIRRQVGQPASVQEREREREREGEREKKKEQNKRKDKEGGRGRRNGVPRAAPVKSELS